MNYAAALFVREDSDYKKIKGVDCYDIKRNALTYSGNYPVIAHPPCRAWGALAHMANPRPGEKQLALKAVEMVRSNGGILEHPEKSKLWRVANLPEPGMFPDSFGGFSVFIDQYWFGHVANKPTKLYIVGCHISQLPPIPYKPGLAEKSITGQVAGTKRATQREREYTPKPLIEWLLDVVLIISRNRN